MAPTANPHEQTTRFGYDVLRRQTRVVYPNATHAYFAYDAAWSPCGAHCSRGWSYLTYGAVNRLTRETGPDTPNGGGLYFAYDDTERVTSGTCGDSGGPNARFYEGAFPARLRQTARPLCFPGARIALPLP